MNRITVNGKTYEVSGNNVQVKNNQIFVDGKLISDETKSGSLTIEWQGPAANIQADGSVHCGNVEGDVDAGGNVVCGQASYVGAGGNVTAGDVTGNIEAGGNISCGKVMAESNRRRALLKKGL